jgi:magnesium chelatase family protein
MNKISGPLLDRIDIHVEVNTVSFDKIVSEKENESSESVRTRVINARDFQQRRFHDLGFKIHSNAMLSAKQVKEICKLSTAGKALLKNAVERLNLSSRAYERILKVSRTIADLAESKNIEIEHLAEAIQYRSLDREGWLK